MIKIDKLANKLTHHDLVVIEDVLIAHRTTLLRHYNSLSEQLDSFSKSVLIVDDDTVLRYMKDLCHTYDSILYIDKILSYYSDIRKDDYLNNDYRL